MPPADGQSDKVDAVGGHLCKVGFGDEGVPVVVHHALSGSLAEMASVEIG